ncbi:LssY-like putative type I secretion system component LssY [Propionicimonas paludicola]|uniref:LssY-like putative type I secretion system component LssY n=1 Tax=Propionicimonas paludicola TaxID=185243 RepID=A0A2A9CPZ2_9ACTN|nr:LssY C-terminal domain-containing protein [Propionicimonas paludicola]PFG16261.1 LssY-like putative type I secretion system component LssY [Propionicimonas paludicola]
MAGKFAARIDGVLFMLAGAASVWFAYLTLQEGITPGWPMLLLVVFWALVAYLVLPRIHRILTRIYVPDYFIGRTRTSDGLLGDPVNLALVGSPEQLHRAMELAGWIRADDLTFGTGWRIVLNTFTRKSYPSAPVSPLFLFGRRQDFAYQQEVAGSPSKRHHVRFWKCPDGWLLPGGFAVGWLAAGTYDRSVGLSLFTLQVTHKIEMDIDREREHVIGTVRAAVPESSVQILEDFSTGYHSRNGGGDLVQTDGHLPIVDLSALPVPTQPGPAEPASTALVPVRRRAPGSVIFGVAATALQALAFLGLGLIFVAGKDVIATSTEAQGITQEVVLAFGVIALVAGLADLVLAVATLAGRNWARLLVCALSLVSVASTFVSRTLENEHGPMHADLIPLAASVLVLLALSSESARSFATSRRSARG